MLLRVGRRATAAVTSASVAAYSAFARTEAAPAPPAPAPGYRPGHATVCVRHGARAPVFVTNSDGSPRPGTEGVSYDDWSEDLRGAQNLIGLDGGEAIVQCPPLLRGLLRGLSAVGRLHKQPLHQALRLTREALAPRRVVASLDAQLQLLHRLAAEGGLRVHGLVHEAAVRPQVDGRAEVRARPVELGRHVERRAAPVT